LTPTARRLTCVAALLALAPGAAQLSAADQAALEQAVRLWLAGWLPLLTATFVASAVIALVTVVHAFMRGHPLWALATLLVGVTAPAYMIKHMPVRRPLCVAAIAVMVSPLGVLMVMVVDAIVNPPAL
jgi:hypothetical protein